MIERNFITQKTKEYYIKKYLEGRLHGVGISQITLKKIPLGEKIIIKASRPSLIVGSKGSNIRELTRHLKKEFKLENPQIEIAEVRDYFLDANIIATRISGSLERFGSARFKGVGHKMIESVMSAGAMGVEIVLSGKIPGSRARSWRFYKGYLKKCGDVSVVDVRKSYKTALLKTGVIGIRVSIMPPGIVLPDHVEILDEPVQVIEEIVPEKETKKKTTKKKLPAKKKTTKKSVDKEETKVVTSKEIPKVEKEETKAAGLVVAPVEKESRSEESQKTQEPAKEEVTPVAPENLPEKVEDAVVKATVVVAEKMESAAEKIVEKIKEVVRGNKE